MKHVELHEIINYFNTHPLPEDPVKIMGCITINEPRRFYEKAIEHLTTCEHSNCSVCSAKYNHLIEFYKEITARQI